MINQLPKAGFVPVQYATGISIVPLTPETMNTLSAYFKYDADGVYRFSEEKQKCMLDQIGIKFASI